MSFYRYFLNEMERSKKCIYSIEYSEEAKQSIDYSDGIYSGLEHGQMSEMDLKDVFTSKEKLVAWYFRYLRNNTKLDVISQIIEEIEKRKLKNLFSVGSGPAVLEYFVKLMTKQDIRMVATDYDWFMVKKAQELLEGIIVEEFDFYKHKISEKAEEYLIDGIIMIGSGCSMDSKKYAEFLREANNSKVKCVFCFEAAIRSNMKSACLTIQCFLMALKKWIIRDELSKECGHAYYRSKRELLSIYKMSGYSIRRLRKTKAYKYCYVLELK